MNFVKAFSGHNLTDVEKQINNWVILRSKPEQKDDRMVAGKKTKITQTEIWKGNDTFSTFEVLVTYENY